MSVRSPPLCAADSRRPVVRKNSIRLPCDRDVGIYLFGLRVKFAKSFCPTLKGFLSTWRKLFGLGLRADSSTSQMLAENVACALAGLQEKRLVFRKISS